MAATSSMDSEMGRRIDYLARPKQFAAGFERDRRSVYWIDREPAQLGPDGITKSIATPRVTALAQHRDPVPQWKGDRYTPMWPVSQGAQGASASERVTMLAQHKNPHPSWLVERTPYMLTSPAARSTECNDWVARLAHHKERMASQKVEDRGKEEWGMYFQPTPAAMHGKASERLESLAEAKRYNKDFHGEKPVQWPVSETALKSLATLRLQQLSRPRSRTMIKDDFDPYRVSPAARKTRATPRVEELCAPLPRKQRTKKVV